MSCDKMQDEYLAKTNHERHKSYIFFRSNHFLCFGQQTILEATLKARDVEGVFENSVSASKRLKTVDVSDLSWRALQPNIPVQMRPWMERTGRTCVSRR